MRQPPDWIDQDSWVAFHEMRKRIKAPLTDYAEKLVIVELVKLKAAGHDPQACLDQSIMLGWRGIFPVRESSVTQTSSAAAETKRMLQQYDAVTSDPAARKAAIDAAKRAIKRVA